MSKRYAWPICTVPGCGHKRTWATEKGAQSASLRHRDSWVKANGEAVCYCHARTITEQLVAPVDLVPTFPCDETERATQHA